MTDIITVFTDNYKEQAHEYTTLLFALSNDGNTTPSDRIERVTALTEAYLDHTDVHADSSVLERLATLVLRDEIDDPHADKMTLEEYPIMSDNQRERRKKRYVFAEEVIFDDRRFNGRRSSHHTDEDGTTHVAKMPITLPNDPAYDSALMQIIVQEALDNARLTERQRQAITLVYYEDKTQEQAAAIMGVRRQVAMRYHDAGLRKLHVYLTEIYGINSVNRCILSP